LTAEFRQLSQISQPRVIEKRLRGDEQVMRVVLDQPALEESGSEPLLPGHGVTTNLELLTPYPTVAPELTLDGYVEYIGSPLPWTWGDWGSGVYADVVVDLDCLPTEAARSSQERAFNTWSNNGVGHGFWYRCFNSGPHWSNSTLRCRTDFGSADVTQTANEVAALRPGL
jgi:hypothetical protein